MVVSAKRKVPATSQYGGACLVETGGHHAGRGDGRGPRVGGG